MKDYLKLMRVKHYLKNFLIFSVIIFSGNLFNTNYLIINTFNFIAFSLISSVIYIINDMVDIKKDCLHPIKKSRPLASGTISKKNAYSLALILFIMGSIFNIVPLFLYSNYSLTNTFLCLYIYLICNILYSKKLKNIPIIDVLILTFGFILRVIYGSVSINIDISSWLYLTVLSASLYFSLGKRRCEYLNSIESRNVLKKYNKEFLDKFMNIFMTCTIVFYCLWANTNNTIFYLISIILVIYILMRYSLIVESDSYGDPVDVVLNDKTLLVSLMVYGLYMGGILYAFG